MKKKFLLGVALAALIGAMCVGFVGCGAGDRYCGYVIDAEEIQGYQVSEQQWTEAFLTFSATEQFSIEIGYCVDVKAELDFTYGGGKRQNGGYVGTEIVKGTKEENKEYVLTGEEASFSGDMQFISVFAGLSFKEVEKRENEVYAEIGGSSFSSYDKVYTKDENNEWEANSPTNYKPLASYFEYSNILPSLSYDDYEYSEQAKGYIFKATNIKVSAGNYITCVVKFDQSGRISAVRYRTVLKNYLVGNTGYPYAQTLLYERGADITITYDNIETVTLPTLSS